MRRDIPEAERLSYPTDPTRAWVFTFGFGHVHPTTGEPLKNQYVRIIGTVESSRLKMVRRYGRAWAFQYPTLEDAGVEKYHLTEYIEDEIKPQADSYDDAQAANEEAEG